MVSETPLILMLGSTDMNHNGHANRRGSTRLQAGELLRITNLRTVFKTPDGVLPAVDGVNLSLARGESLGIVGESGCGKSMTALSVMRLVPKPHGAIVEGSILYSGRNGGPALDIAKLHPNGTDMRSIRGNEIAMIFQEPMSALNPVYTIGAQIDEVIRLHQRVHSRLARRRAIEMLERVRIPNAGQRVNDYPHELSGGMRQRVMVAMALSCNPALLIADEPTTALDVTIEAQILQIIRELKEELGMAVIFISHDLDVIGEIADRVAVMYTGKVIEEGSTEDVFMRPAHPYTTGLLASRPRIGRKERLQPIVGSVPSLDSIPPGCPFAPRCPHVFDPCRRYRPPSFIVDYHGRPSSSNLDHRAACWLHDDPPKERS